MGKILNPIITGFNPDPTICKFKGSYYLATSTFEYFPGIAIYKSNDLVNFELICNALNTDDLNLNKCGNMSGVYAATLRSHNGLMYMITTNTSGQGHMYVSTSNPESGVWSKPTYVKGGGFDPDLFFDDDGTVYFLREDFDHYGIVASKIDINTGELLSKEKRIYSKFEDKKCEAPHLYKINKYYYLLVAEGGTFRGHMVAIARSSSPLGEYELCPHNPILTHRCEVMEPIQSCGHMDFIDDGNGNYYAYFLATRPNGNYHHLGRETFIAPLNFDNNSWPHINYDNNIDLIMDIPGLANRLSDSFKFNADFSKKLSPHFICRRNPKKSSYYMADGQLNLFLDKNEFANIKHRSFLGIRQKNFNCTLNTKVSLTTNGIAGLSVIMNDTHHYDIFLSNEENQRYICVRKQIGDIKEITKKVLYDSQTANLEISADKDKYTFSYINNDNKIELCTGLTYLLSSEVASTFTGVVLGMFAKGSNNGYAHFSEFNYFGVDRDIS